MLWYYIGCLTTGNENEEIFNALSLIKIRHREIRKLPVYFK